MKTFTQFISEGKVEDFENLGNLQRDKPEKAMLRVQHTLGGGVMNMAVEHIGDLTHRMSHMARHDNYLHDIVQDKVHKAWNLLTHPYGFEREHNENIEANANARGQDKRQLNTLVDKHLADYADEHAKLPVYNIAQYHARETAVALGKKNFKRAIGHLSVLRGMTSSKQVWDHFATQHDPNWEQKFKAKLDLKQWE